MGVDILVHYMVETVDMNPLRIKAFGAIYVYAWIMFKLSASHTRREKVSIGGGRQRRNMLSAITLQRQAELPAIPPR
jgi:hypothetical protein